MIYPFAYSYLVLVIGCLLGYSAVPVLSAIRIAMLLTLPAVVRHRAQGALSVHAPA